MTRLRVSSCLVLLGSCICFLHLSFSAASPIEKMTSNRRQKIEVLMRMMKQNSDEHELHNIITNFRRSALIGLHRAEKPTKEEPCSLPNCFPPKSGIPGGLSRSDVPQLVFFTFDDAVTPINKDFYDRLFNDNRKNPNGCPIRATFFNSHNYTVYNLVEDLYQKGHEIGSHSITHREPPSWWEHASIQQYKEEIVGQRDNIHRFAGVPTEEIRGMRVPFLALGSDNQFTMLLENNFTYDATMVARSDPPSWPFTLQQPEKLTSDLCSTEPKDCPKKPYPLWEVPLNMLYMVDKTGGQNCSGAMVDACRPGWDQPSKAAALDYLRLNFFRHHNAATKPPFGINMHAAWFQQAGVYFEAMQEFVDELLRMKDVYIVPAIKVIEWIRTPTPLSKLDTFGPFSCKK